MFQKHVQDIQGHSYTHRIEEAAEKLTISEQVFFKTSPTAYFTSVFCYSYWLKPVVHIFDLVFVFE